MLCCTNKLCFLRHSHGLEILKSVFFGLRVCACVCLCVFLFLLIHFLKGWFVKNKFCLATSSSILTNRTVEPPTFRPSVRSTQSGRNTECLHMMTVYISSHWCTPTTQWTLPTLPWPHPPQSSLGSTQLWPGDLRGEASTETEEKEEGGGGIFTTPSPVYTHIMTVLSWSTQTLTLMRLGNILLVSLLEFVFLCGSMRKEEVYSSSKSKIRRLIVFRMLSNFSAYLELWNSFDLNCFLTL